VNRKILITGASGFVGSNLVPYLNSNGFECVTISIRNDEQLFIPSDIYAIVHLSGKAHDTSNNVKQADYFESNFELTKKIYNEFLSSKTTKFIFMSSVKAVCDTTDGVLDENFEPSPVSPYGKSKLLAEQFIQKQKNDFDKKYFILRPCMIHGPGNKGNLNLLYKFALLGLPYPLGSFNNKRSFLSITNLNFVIKEILLREDIPVGIYNIADDLPLSVSGILQLINKVLNKKNKILNLSPSLVKSIARIGDILYLPFNSIRLKKLTENYIVSNKKIREVINEKMPIDSVDGLINTIRSFRKEQ
jgi:nucleoside-diphosphate-sugar epimerase